MLRLLARRDAIVHCAAGKNRTGLVIALLLSLLGVADADISTDFASSNADVELEKLACACGLELREVEELGGEDLRPFVGVAPDCDRPRARIRAGAIGGVEAFVRGRAGVSGEDLEALRSALVVDVAAAGKAPNPA